MNELKKELNGAWEERGVIGTRIEINGSELTVLWMNAPVLETSFKTRKGDGFIELVPKATGMRYAGESKDYAQVVRFEYSDGKLTFTERFPITGESKTVLSKTENSRFGDYFTDEKTLKKIHGVWKSDDGAYELVIRNGELTLFGQTAKICVLRPKSGGDVCIVADRDPSKYGFFGFTRFELEGDALKTRLIVCDAPSPLIIFKKRK